MFNFYTIIIQVKKLQREQKTELLNTAMLLLQMRSAIKRLMEKCESIAKKLESHVQDLTKGRGTLELSMQPKIIPEHLRLANYQMIG
jgi:hypothetical protein